MADATLNGLETAILVTDGFEPALHRAGAETRLVSPGGTPAFDSGTVELSATARGESQAAA